MEQVALARRRGVGNHVAVGWLGILSGWTLADVLKQPETLHLTDAQIGLSSSIYLIGAVTGALGFGYATDWLGRKKLF